MALLNQIFYFHLAKVETLLNQAADEVNPAAWLFANNFRTPIFMLEATARLASKVYDNKDFEKLNERFKALEDALGIIDFYAGFAKDFADNKKVSLKSKKYLAEKQSFNTYMLNDLLVEDNWLNGKRIKKIRQQISANKDQSDKKELKGIIAYYEKSIMKLNDFMIACAFSNIEEDIHELRRRLRWLSIYPQATLGVFAYKMPNSRVLPFQKKYLVKEILKSPFNIMPTSLVVENPIFINKNSFIALSYTIAELGMIKDAGLKIEVLAEAIHYTSNLEAIQAIEKAHTILGKRYPTKAALLESAQNLSNTFFAEKNLENILAL